MKAILAVTDMSIRSDRALKRAALLAKASGAGLTVLHVVDEDLPAAIVETVTPKAKAELDTLCDALDIEGAAAEVVVGEPVAAIVEAAARLKADLLVMGVHRERPFLDMFSGGTMERIVRAASLPVLMVAAPPAGPYKAALCGIDLSPACAAAARAAATVAPGARIDTWRAVHIPFRGFIAPGDDPAAIRPFLLEAQAALDAWWATADMPEVCQKPRPEPLSVSQAFRENLRRSGAELVAVGAHARAGVVAGHLGGFTEELLRVPPCDVLVVRG